MTRPTPAGLLPRLLERRMRSGADRVPPWSEETHGAVLFADLSGFTALAERLSARGPEGIEELSRLLNACFGPMVDALIDMGGDVVRFAGDAPIALFECAEDALPDAVARATECGRTLLSRLAEVAAAERLALAMRVSVAAGGVRLHALGGHEGRWELLVDGEAFDQVAPMQARTAPGEVALSDEAARLAAIEGGLAGRTDPPATRSRESERSEGLSERLRGFIPRGLVERLDAGQAGWLAERRPVSVAFVRVQLQSAAQLDEGFAALQRAVYAGDGSINQFLRDDKGLVLVAVWGVPGRTHEDDAARAVEAARRAVATLGSIGARASAGVATGRAFCGWRGNERRREYAIIGDVMNLAARLMMLDDAGVRCDGATAASAASAIQFTTHEPVRLKGKAEPVAVFAPGAAADTWQAAPAEELGALVGRAAECAAIDAALDAAAARRGAIVLLSGEPGIGKSRLLGEAAARARARSLRVLTGAASPVGAADAWHAWRGVLSTLLDLPPQGAADRATALTARFGSLREHADARSAVARLLQVQLPGENATAELTRAASGDAVRDLILALLAQAAARTPLLLLFDDAHAIDSLSLRLAHDAARRVPGLAVLLAARTAAVGESLPDLDAITADATTELLTLPRLDAGDVGMLLMQRLGVRHVPVAVTRLVHERSAGNPLFVGEFADSLRAERLLLVEGDTCRLALDEVQLRAHRFPESVQGMVLGRLDRLTPSQQFTVKLASVLGTAFDEPMLSALHRLTGATEDGTAVDALVAAGVFERTAVPGPVAFRYAVAQEAAYGLLTAQQRDTMHRAAAERYEALDSSSPPWPLLAYHWSRTTDHVRAARSLERAAQESFEDGADRESARFFEQLLALASIGRIPDASPVQRARWQRQAANARLRLGENLHGRDMLDAALAELGHRFPRARGALAFRLVGELVRQVAHLTIPSRVRAVVNLRDGAARLEAAHAFGLLGPAAYYDHDALAYVTASLASLNIAEAADAPGIAGDGCVALGYISAVMGLTRLSEHYWGIAERHGDPASQHSVLIARAMHATACGRNAECERLAQRTVEVGRATRDWTAYEKGLWMSFTGHQSRGARSAAFESVRALHASAVARDHRQHLLWAHLGLASHALEGGELGDSGRELDAAYALLGGADPATRMSYFVGRIRLTIAQRDLPRLAREAAEIQSQLGAPADFPSTIGRAVLTDALLLLWDTAPDAERAADARAQSKRLLRSLRASTRYAPGRVPRAERFAGEILAREGDVVGAREHFARALGEARARDLPTDEAFALERLGTSGAEPPERRERLTAARGIFDALGQDEQRRRIDSILDA